MAVRVGLVFAALGLLAAPGCGDQAPVELPIQPAPPASYLQQLEPGPLLRVDRREAAESGPWWLSLLAPQPNGAEFWSVSGNDFKFEALVVARPGPAVILLPHLEGTPRIARYVASRFSAAGYQVFAMLPPGRALRPDVGADALLRLLQLRIRMGRLAARLVNERMEPRCRVLVGISLGAMTAIPVAALEPDMDAVVSMLGGGGLGWLAERSAEPVVRALHTAAQPVSDPERRHLAALSALVDPLTWAPRLQPDRVLTIRALWDRAIPAPAATGLWEALGKPRQKVYPSGHYSFGFMLPMAVGAAIEHADERCGHSSN